MLGAIAGDIVGSVYEARPIKTKDFPLFESGCRFTDDSILTVAVAHAILTGLSYREAIRIVGRRYPNAGYGGTFIQWLLGENRRPYNSWGNGSAMRVSPIGLAYDDEATVLLESRRSAEITHNHPEGIKGAQATALAVFIGLRGASKDEIRRRIERDFGYDLHRTVDEIRPGYSFDVSCQGSVPEAIVAFLDAVSFEDAVRNAVSLGGDSDTLACIAGGIAEAFYGQIPAEILREVASQLPTDLWTVMCDLYRRHGGDSVRAQMRSLGAW
jgi:ADP-ribosylglycohydrolase